MSDFMQALLDAMPTPHARMVAVAVLSRYAGESVYLPVSGKAGRRAQAAANMLANGVAPTDIAHALRERFGISARTAFRDVKLARKMS